MQATIFAHDPDVAAARVVTDDGVAYDVAAPVLDASGLRHLRAGQRVSVDLVDGVVTRLWLVGIGEGEIIR